MAIGAHLFGIMQLLQDLVNQQVDKFFVFVRMHPNLVFQWYKGRNVRVITGDCKLDAPINFIRGISAGKLDTLRLDFVVVSDERGSVVNDYL